MGLRGLVPLLLIGLGSLLLFFLSLREKRFQLKLAGIVLFLLALLLVSASITFRQEYRWLLSGEFIFLTGLVLLTSHARLRWALPAFAIVAAGVAIADGIARAHVQNVFFIGWTSEAENGFFAEFSG